MGYEWSFGFLLRYAPLFWKGIGVTLAYTVGTILIGLLIGLLIGDRAAVAVLAGERAAGGDHRGVPLHPAAGADRLVLLRAAGDPERADPGDGGGDPGVVAVYRRLLRGDLPRRHRLHRARPVGRGAGAGAVAVERDAQGGTAAGGAADGAAVHEPVDHPVEEHLVGLDHRRAGPAVPGHADHRRHLDRKSVV